MANKELKYPQTVEEWKINPLSVVNIVFSIKKMAKSLQRLDTRKLLLFWTRNAYHEHDKS